MSFKHLTVFAASLLISGSAIAQCNDIFTLTGPTGTVCTTRDIQLTATSFPGATYTWTGPAGSGFGGNLPYNPVINNLSLANNGIYSVTVTLPNGCSYTAAVNVTVEVTPPKPTVTIQSTPACPKETIHLIAHSGSPIGSTYYWSGTNWPGFSSSVVNTADIINVQPNNTGVYSVYIESTAGCKSDVTDFSIQVYPEVIAGFTTQTFLGCEDDSVQFTNTSTGGSIYDWSFGDGLSSPLTDPLHTYKNQGSYTVRLIAANAFCKDTAMQQVSFKHEIKAAFITDKDSVCQGQPIAFTNQTTYDPAVLPDYFWKFMDNTTDNVINPVHTYTNTGIYRARLIATDYLGCKDSAERILFVDSAGSISFVSSEEEVCPGKTIDFKGIYMQQGNTGIVWNLGDGNIIPNKSAINYTFDESGTYDVKFIASYRICPNAEFVKQIRIKPMPKINLGPDTNICFNGKELTLKDRINEMNPAATWNWNNPARDVTPTITVRYPGSYAATVELDGCTAADTVVVSNGCFINIPNAFTPNGDGNGDYFLPREALSEGVTAFNMTIYNRWGQVIFATDNINGRGWDGKYNNEPQPIGVYVYTLNVGFLNGAKEKYQGNITLLR